MSAETIEQIGGNMPVEELLIEQAGDPDSLPSDYEIRKDRNLLALTAQSLPDACVDCRGTQLDYLTGCFWRIGRLGLVGMLNLIEEKHGCRHDNKLEWANTVPSQTA